MEANGEMTTRATKEKKKKRWLYIVVEDFDSMCV